MADILRHHNVSPDEKALHPEITYAPVPDIHGTGSTHPITAEDYAGIPDPLSSGTAVANKPASSIPSIFGRPIFFRTALASIKPQNIDWNNGIPPVYNQIVSQWLDLMEIVFNESQDLIFEKWVKDEQVQLLKDSGHAELGEALESHMSKFFPGTDTLYLISTPKDGLIGATSPYTFVFTSTNWTSGKPVLSLFKRDTRFREFMYHIYLAYDSGIHDQIATPNGMRPNPAKTGIKGMLTYLKNCLDNEPDLTLKTRINGQRGHYLFTNLATDYPKIEYRFVEGAPAQDILIAQLRTGVGADSVDMFLPTRRSTDMQTDFFIDSDLVPFDIVKTPLALITGQYGKLLYYDDNFWDNNTVVPQVENEEELVRRMPKCKGYSHNWLTEIDLVEDKLVQLPYELNDKKFETIVAGGNTRFLIPLKPKAFKYFSLEKIKENLSISVNSVTRQVEMKFTIPVRNNDGTRKHNLVIARNYNMGQDIVQTNPVLGSLTVGFSPFLKVTNGLTDNEFTVMLHYAGIDQAGANLEFFSRGEKIEAKSDQRNDNPVAKFYRIHKLFDVARIVLECKDGSILGGAILPKMEEVQQGAQKYFYAIDFGTTNTHIAYISDADTMSHSFGPEEIAMQVVYIAKRPDVDRLIDQSRFKEVVEAINKTYGGQGRQLIFDEAREFFPNFVGQDYSFPIRTALYQKPLVEDNLFGSASIGFRFSKENFNRDIQKYKTTLKWDLNSISTGPESDIRVRLFFEELLMMVRNHWLSRDDADKTDTPTIVLTYPLAMTNSSKMMRQWNIAYKRVFGVEPVSSTGQSKIIQIAESLAPAQKIITAGIAKHVDGILNVDIGGGTTDIQYFRSDGVRTIARYNSVQFAGDDLWGVGFENLGAKLAKPDNQFTRMARTDLNGRRVKIGYEEIPVSDITLTGKEFVNMLLRDSDKQFIDLITEREAGNSIQRKTMMLHYAALIFHIAKWIESDPKMAEKFPAVINFTGFGSKYIEGIFGENGERQLIQYTKLLLEKFGIDPSKLSSSFKVRFEPNPKAVTAEGAALLAKNGATNIPQRASRHFGFDNSDGAYSFITLGDAETLKPRVMDFFDEFLQGFQAAVHPDLNVVPLTDQQRDNLRESADGSYEQTRVYKSQPASASDTVRVDEIRIDDSLFFWALKGALCDLDMNN